MSVYLDLPVGLREKLWSHLLQSDTEQVAFVFAAVTTDGEDTVLTGQDHYLASPGDFEIHSEFHVELTDEARARIIRRAWDTGTSPVEFHSHLGIVPQEAFLFSGTIRDNIAYGREAATNADVEAAARAVGAHDFIASLPGGYLQWVSERGRSLSSGQRQLIALARAHLVDPALLLLDEATSNLDLKTEAKVQAAMGIASRGRTTILIAHRLQTARLADRIVVIDAGKVIEDGTHAELLERRGRYAEMWAASEGEPAAAAN